MKKLMNYTVGKKLPSLLAVSLLVFAAMAHSQAQITEDNPLFEDITVKSLIVSPALEPFEITFDVATTSPVYAAVPTAVVTLKEGIVAFIGAPWDDVLTAFNALSVPPATQQEMIDFLGDQINSYSSGGNAPVADGRVCFNLKKNGTTNANAVVYITGVPFTVLDADALDLAVNTNFDLNTVPVLTNTVETASLEVKYNENLDFFSQSLDLQSAYDNGRLKRYTMDGVVNDVQMLNPDGSAFITAFDFGSSFNKSTNTLTDKPYKIFSALSFIPAIAPQ